MWVEWCASRRRARLRFCPTHSSESFPASRNPRALSIFVSAAVIASVIRYCGRKAPRSSLPPWGGLAVLDSRRSVRGGISPDA